MQIPRRYYENLSGLYMVAVFSHADVVVIFHGHNDFQRGMPVGFKALHLGVGPDADCGIIMERNGLLRVPHIPGAGKIVVESFRLLSNLSFLPLFCISEQYPVKSPHGLRRCANAYYTGHC